MCVFQFQGLGDANSILNARGHTDVNNLGDVQVNGSDVSKTKGVGNGGRATVTKQCYEKYCSMTVTWATCFQFTHPREVNSRAGRIANM